MSDGKNIFAATSENEIIDLLRRGQGVFGIALEGVFEDLAGRHRTCHAGRSSGRGGGTGGPRAGRSQPHSSPT